jgi:uncharacterized protein (TIGR02145 family)
MKTMNYAVILLIASTICAVSWVPGEDLLDTRDGQLYKTATIGNQVWMAENLNIGELVLSDKPGAIMQNNGIIEKYCWDNALDGCDELIDGLKRGGFYEWQEAVQKYDGAPSEPVKGVCPEGWHIPSNTEWNELLNYLTSTYNISTYPELADCLLVGGASGFNAVLTGYRCTMNGGFRVSAMTPDTRTYYYTAEQADNENAPAIEIGVGSFTSFNIPKSIGLCIRCIMDEGTANIDDEQSTDLDIKVFPNPAFDHILLLGAEQYAQVKVISLAGKVLINAKYNSQLDISKLDSGIYFVVVGETVLKFVKI